MNQNIIFLTGFVGRDAESKLVGESHCTKFTLCTDDGYYNRDKNEWVPQPNWHNIIVWRKLSQDVAQYIKKGNKVTLTGKLTCREYETNEGDKRRAYEVVATKLEQLVVKPKSNSSFPSEEPSGKKFPAPKTMEQKFDSTQPEAPEDDLPF